MTDASVGAALLKIIAVLSILFGLIGLREATRRMPDSEADRTFHFLMGLVFCLLGVLLWRVVDLI